MKEEKYIGNIQTKEFHLVSCERLPIVANQILFSDIKEALEKGYNGCYFCLKEFDTDRINELVNNIPSAREETNFLNLSTATLDNVTWHDFVEYQYLLTPQYFEVVPDLPSEPITEEELTSIEEIADSIEEPTELISLIEFNQTLKSKIKGKIERDGLDEVYCAWNKLTIKKPGLFDELTDIEGCELEICIPIPFIVDCSSTYSKNDREARKIGINKVTERIMAAYSQEYDVQATLLEIYNNLKALGPHDESAFFNWIDSNLISYENRNNFYLNVLRNTMGATLTQRWQEIGNNVKNDWSQYLTPPPEPIPPIQPPVLPPDDTPYDEEEPEDLIYPFYIYKPYSWNFGLRLVYRQEWRQLGNQRGEIVKTIPLGPKQTEKVSTKIIRRTKLTKQSENLKSTETTTETSDTTKDSTEVIQEASKSFGWNVEAEASVNWSWGSAQISGGMKSESEEKSKESINHLSETIQKTASKLRTETKVIVSLESESTFETATATEIINPNEEIPITYIYSKLQRQYEILTSLAELHNVVMIAEPIPKPWEVDVKWVKTYDWIIAKFLLDDSYRDALNSISLEIGQGYTVSLENMQKIMDSTIEKLGEVAGDRKAALSISNVDIVREAQINYRESIKEYIEQMKQYNRLKNKQKRLFKHIRENILHYCKAIWSHEDPQQRILRYRKQELQIPLEWTLNGNDIDLDTLVNSTLENFEGEFTPVPDSPSITLADLINPAGPIGYHGNYAIYYMKPEYSNIDLCIMLQLSKAPYLYYPSIEADPILLDPLLRRYYEDHLGEEPSTEEKFEMVDYIPELRMLYITAKSNGISLNDFVSLTEYQNLFTENYPEFLFRREQCRRFALDTNNLLIDIEPGTGTALESFKLAHRRIDVLKAQEEKEKLSLENEKLRQLLAHKQFDVRYWPDTDKVVVIDGKENGLPFEVASKLASGSIKRKKGKKNER